MRDTRRKTTRSDLALSNAHGFENSIKYREFSVESHQLLIFGGF